MPAGTQLLMLTDLPEHLLPDLTGAPSSAADNRKDIPRGREAKMTAIDIITADLDRRSHQEAIIDLLDTFSRDAMGNNRPM